MSIDGERKSDLIYFRAYCPSPSLQAHISHALFRGVAEQEPALSSLPLSSRLNTLYIFSGDLITLYLVYFFFIYYAIPFFSLYN